MLREIKKDLILSGTDSVAVAKQDGVTYRISPVEEIHQIVVNNLIKGDAKIVDISQVLRGYYQILGVSIALALDAKGVPPVGDYGDTSRTTAILIRMYQGNVLLQSIVPRIHRGLTIDRESYFDANSTWEIYSDRDIDKLTLTCIPVLKSDTYFWE